MLPKFKMHSTTIKTSFPLELLSEPEPHESNYFLTFYLLFSNVCFAVSFKFLI